MRLTEKEQRHVRTALRFLRFKAGEWTQIAKALHVRPDTLRKVARGRRGVTPRLAVAVARLSDASVGDLLAGELVSERTCPHCGRPPDDFEDEETVVEDQPRQAVLKLVK